MWFDETSAPEKVLVAKDIDEFRQRLKSSFGVVSNTTVAASSEDSTCLICCTDIKEYASISRKCLVKAFPCSGPSCACESQICYGCYVEYLWKSPRSQKGLGRYRAGCPACRAEYCHYDVVRIVRPQKVVAVEVKAPSGPLSSRYSMRRLCSPEERHRISEWIKEEAIRIGQSADPIDRVRSYHMSKQAKGEELVLEGLSSEQRKEIHRVAENLHLQHESRGEGDARCIVVWKDQHGQNEDSAEDDELSALGYLMLTGPSVECAALQFKDRVEDALKEARQKRDGKEHHITIVGRKELDQLAIARTGSKKGFREVLLELAKSFFEHVTDDWTPVGLGRVVENPHNEAFFVVVDWPAATAWREKMGLKPHDFHITLGFKQNDIHGVSKNRGTLV